MTISKIAYFKKHPLLATVTTIIWNMTYGLFQLYLFHNHHSYRYIALSAFFLVLGLSSTAIYNAIISYRRKETRNFPGFCHGLDSGIGKNNDRNLRQSQ